MGGNKPAASQFFVICCKEFSVCVKHLLPRLVNLKAEKHQREYLLTHTWLYTLQHLSSVSYWPVAPTNMLDLGKHPGNKFFVNSF